MISSSWFWKEELARQVVEFDASWERLRKTDWCDRSRFHMERTLFYSAMAIRRLIDSHKLTDKLARQSLTMEAFKAKAKKPHTVRSQLGSVSVDQWFEMDKPEQVSLTPHQLASEILHSFTLEILIDESHVELDSILVASDWNQFKRAIVIPKTTWLNLLRAVVADEVMSMSVTRKEDGNPEIKIS